MALRKSGAVAERDDARPTAQALLDAGFAAGDREMLDLLDRNFRMVMDNRRW